MAYFQRSGSRVRVFVYSAEDGKPKALPRKKTKHLDSQPDDVVRLIVEREWGRPKAQSHEPPLDLQKQFEGFLLYSEGRGKSQATLKQYKTCFLKYIVPFFVGQENLPVNLWPSVSVKLLPFLKDNDVSNHNILKANSTLSQFWKWLCEEGSVEDVSLRLRRPTIKKQKTPLRKAINPSDVLSFARNCNDESVKLMALCGYFMSLRTQETLALRREIFIAGSRAEALQCCKAMKQVGLYSRLAAKIQEQRGVNWRKGGAVPKADSAGWVACFDEQAAIEIVAIIRNKEGYFLNHFSPEWLIRKWRRGVKGTALQGVTLKDLRRASLYWLGHNSNLPIVALKHHARHSNITTTELYLRRPEEELIGFDELDLDA